MKNKKIIFLVATVCCLAVCWLCFGAWAPGDTFVAPPVDLPTTSDGTVLVRLFGLPANCQFAIFGIVKHHTASYYYLDMLPSTVFTFDTTLESFFVELPSDTFDGNNYFFFGFLTDVAYGDGVSHIPIPSLYSARAYNYQSQQWRDFSIVSQTVMVDVNLTVAETLLDIYFQQNVDTATYEQVVQDKLELQQGYVDLRSDYNDLLADYSQLQTDFSILEIYTNQIRGSLAEARTEIATLETEIATLEMEIARLNNVIDSLESGGTALDFVGTAFEKVGDILQIQILPPNITIGTIVAVPLILGVVFLVLRLVRGE